MLVTCHPHLETCGFFLALKTIFLVSRKISNPDMQQTLKAEEDDDDDHKEALGIWDCGSPLYDSYELVSVSHLIERHLMALPSLGGSSRRFITNIFSHSSASSDHHIASSSSTSPSLEGMVLKGSNSSIVGSLSDHFVGNNIWKMWKRKDKKTKKKKIGFSGFYNKIGLWRKKDQHR